MKYNTRLVLMFIAIIVVPSALFFVTFLLYSVDSGASIAFTDDTVIFSKDTFVVIVISMVAVLTATSVAITIWYKLSVFKPLKRLDETIKQIENGDLDTPLERESGELGNLFDDFENMRLTLNDSIDTLIEYDRYGRELVSNISHDLRTPITSIKGYVEGIMDNVADTPEKKERYIKTIYKKAKDMDRLVNELNVFSRIDSDNMTYHMEVLPICGYFDDCADELAVDAESHDFRFSYDNRLDRDVMVEIDPEQMTRVINNIVNNSFKYAGEKDNKIELKIEKKDDEIFILFKDNGKGIRPDDAEKIFERFYRTDESRGSATGGSGIGLSIVKKVVKAHGGAVYAKGEPGKGLEITIVLPEYDENATSDKKHKIKDEHERSSRLNKILSKKTSERK